MSKFMKILSVTLCAVFILGCMSGCGEKYKEAYIYFELLEKPKTLDPQIASSDSELLIVRNIYEGLLRRDIDGKICILYGLRRTGKTTLLFQTTNPMKK